MVTILPSFLAIMPNIAPHAAVQPSITAAAPQMDIAAVGAFIGAVVTLLCLVERRRGPRYELGLALGCGYSAVFAMLSGAWPAGMVLAVFAGISIKTWHQRRNTSPHIDGCDAEPSAFRHSNRIHQLFGDDRNGSAPVTREIWDN